jgi:hypothetical protein
MYIYAGGFFFFCGIFRLLRVKVERSMIKRELFIQVIFEKFFSPEQFFIRVFCAVVFFKSLLLLLNIGLA